MILSDNRQRNSAIIAEAHSLLIAVKKLTHKKISVIAKEIGVSYRTLWALEKEKSGSTQLLAGLKLLLEVETLKRARPPATLQEMIAVEVERRLSSDREAVAAQTVLANAAGLNDAGSSAKPPPIVEPDKPVQKPKDPRKRKPPMP